MRVTRKIKFETDLTDIPNKSFYRLYKLISEEFVRPYQKAGAKQEIMVPGSCVWNLLNSFFLEAYSRDKK